MKRQAFEDSNDRQAFEINDRRLRMKRQAFGDSNDRR